MWAQPSIISAAGSGCSAFRFSHRPIDYETTSIDGIGFKLGLGPMGHDGVYRHGYTLYSSFPITTPCFVISATDPHSTLIVA